MNAPLPRSVLADRDELARRLERETEGETRFDIASRGRYATDASIYQQLPVGVFVPKTQRDVAIALQIARELGAPLLPRGGGTSQCGQTTGAALVIDFSKHLRRVLSLDVQALRAEVEPGLVLDHLNAELKKHGLWYPVDVSTGAQATLGGMAGNNSCGSRSIAYGNMVHNVARIAAWMADGSELDFGPLATLGAKEREIAEFVRGLAQAVAPEIDAHWPTVMRRVSGYNLDIFRPRSERPYTADGSVNLAHLLVGAEGTLALTRSLTLALAPLPRHKVLGVVNFARFHTAMDSAQHIVKLGPSAVELVDRTMIELARANPAFRPVIETALIDAPDAILLVEFSGEERAPLLAQLQALVELMADLGLAGSVVEMPDEGAQKALWEVRKAGLNIMMSLKGDGKPVSFIEDCAVPLEHLAEYTDALTEVFAKHGTRGTWYAHASVGTLHVRPILDMRRDGAPKMRAIAEEAAALVRKYRGAYSGEHGDGLCRGEWIRWQFGAKIDDAFRAIKQRLDPGNQFNPGKIIDPPKMDEARLMRFPPGYKTIPLTPVLDWSAWNVQNDPVTEQTTAPGTGGDNTGGLAKAVEMCNNNGHCRKFDAGTMCPSYRVTRDEQHLTRGRANTLRLALSGQLGDETLDGEAVKAALDLCVSCKGCKRDCPTGVDMARMKVEATAAYKRRHGHTLRDRLIAHLPRYARFASALPWLFNLRDQVPLLARWSEGLLGFAAARSLPRWRRDTVRREAPRYGLADADQALAASKAVVLWVDTFNGHFETENARDAVRVLQTAGYAVHVPGLEGETLCCGRTYLATGMPERAKASAAALVAALAPFAAQGIAIVGLEPSCLLSLRDEVLGMGLGEAAKAVAAQALTFEEFLAREAKAGRFAPALSPAARPIKVHGHCHQKAFGVMQPVLEVLRLIPGAKPELIESSCCGMAGSFGYEAEHHAVSMQMAELSLLPEVRAASDAWIVADGASCRHQIADGAQREALHVARVLAAHLTAPGRG
ncbi:MAG: FAD-binding protein [Piscinibacter sp.]|uniref:FAD-binding and (Fe-S)-binding domain-containing protein n=1 Tax=Piscinibacter sp. TaxID=1903157 RepID=UPI001B70EA79|nr:FAD-binding and (Fe-S)-binding domain-containing protein [Piscinibacter sp.]MBP5989819.1 FAD-binding protein [Piscinibacter sp.]MBP6027026.1 FAD-binding protein [Piscinibacter sp.]